MQIERKQGLFAHAGLLILLLGLAGIGVAWAGDRPTPTITSQLEEMRALDVKLAEHAPDSERFRRLAEFYRARLADRQASGVRAGLSDEDLRALTLAAQLAVFYHHDDDILDDAMTGLRLLEDDDRYSAMLSRIR